MNWIIGYLVIGVVWSLGDHLWQWRKGWIGKLDQDLFWSVSVTVVIWPLSMLIVWACRDDGTGDPGH